MAPKSSLATLFALTTTAAAQSSLLTLPFFGYDDQPVVASVVAVNDAVTTLQLACPEGEDQNDCGLALYQTLTVGSSTYNMYLSDDDFVMTQDCSAATADYNVVCAESASGAAANDPGSSTTTYELTDVAVLTVTVTAGASKLAAAGAAATSTGPASTSATATASASSSHGVIVVTGSSGSVSTSTLAKSTSTGSAKSSSSGSSTGSAAAASTTTNAAVANLVTGPALLAAGAGLMAWLL